MVAPITICYRRKACKTTFSVCSPREPPRWICFELCLQRRCSASLPRTPVSVFWLIVRSARVQKSVWSEPQRISAKFSVAPTAHRPTGDGPSPTGQLLPQRLPKAQWPFAQAPRALPAGYAREVPSSTHTLYFSRRPSKQLNWTGIRYKTLCAPQESTRWKSKCKTITANPAHTFLGDKR